MATMVSDIFEKVTVSRDDSCYSAWPDVVMAADGHLLSVFTECKHHCNREHSRLVICDSFDKGKTWSKKRALTAFCDATPYYYNCARLACLKDNRLCVIVDRVPRSGESNGGDRKSTIAMFFSNDNGRTWTEPVETPIRGIVPSKLTILDTGRWLISTHYEINGKQAVFLRYSDDEGTTWSDEITVASSDVFNLCEGSLLPLGGGIVVVFMRENSRRGLDCMKSVSYDNGETWGPVTAFPLPGCHRPVAGLLKDGRLMITFRFVQGAGGFGFFTQNLFCAIAEKKDALATSRDDVQLRIVPVDYDRSKLSDTGYSGWVEMENREMFIVNYIVDDALDHAQIRGYRFNLSNLML